MGDIAIRAHGLSKRYAIGGTQRQWNGLAKDRSLSKQEDANTIWALRDVSFEVKQGEVLGIIGRNGSGKSTLLKILSRITKPTRGEADIHGRVGSLLEVGTGFHPELTGRENIRLNGVLLGMKKAEIDRRFDAIVAFAEVENFIDTPVKRYSSGMYMRLAFAVAAHVQCEILLVDEVLAVGDAQFQKKCLTMLEQQQVKGRTVFFVSHNMGAIRTLCTRVLVLRSGELSYDGEPNEGVRKYLEMVGETTGLSPNDFLGTLTDKMVFTSLEINGRYGFSAASPEEGVTFVLRGDCLERVPKFRFSVSVSRDGLRIFTVHDGHVPAPIEKGYFRVTISIPPYTLRPGLHTIGIGGHDGGVYDIGNDWLYANDIATLDIKSEWSEKNDFGGTGIVNVPHVGTRECI
ncbi:MAG: ABC transporter ATP-binding protein [Nitrospira sp.]|nr:ABC transporter ATP-binding protein [Nitrospira sp.]